MADPAQALDPVARFEAGLRAALNAAGFHRGERFEVVRLQEVPGQKSRRPSNIVTGDPAEVARWVGEDLANLYLTLNPIRPDARPRGHASNGQVAIARVLVLDVDPRTSDAADREDAARLAEDLAKLLELQLGVRPVRLSSGRGRGLWVRHEPEAVPESAQVREVLTRGLAHRFRGLVGGAFLDETPWQACSMARVPGSINPRTGDVVELLDPGDGQVATWGRFAGLAAQLRRELPPPPDVRIAIPADTRKLFLELVSAAEWTWLGSQAGRRGVHSAVRDVVPSDCRDAYDRGAADPRRRWEKPANAATAKRIERAVQRLEDAAQGKAAVATAREQIEVLEVVRRIDGPGRPGRIDLHVRVNQVEIVVRGLSGKDVRSYAAVAARAAEAGALLPELGQKAKEFWDRALRERWDKQRVVEEEGTLHQAIQSRLRVVLRSRRPSDAKTVDELAQGHPIKLDDGRLALDPELVVGAVRDQLQGDIVPREAIAEAALALGFELGARVSLTCDGALTRRRVWAYPASLLTSDD